MKKTVSIILILVLAAGGTSCGTAKQPQAEAPAPVGIANPVEAATSESLLNDIGIDLSALNSYDNAVFTKINGSPAVGQVSFAFEGDEYNYRVATPPQEQDISGMYYTWNVTSQAQVGHCTASVNVADGGQGVISWYDIAPGVMYTLSMSANADAEKLITMANRLFTPVQGEADGDFTGAFEALLCEIRQDYHPGTAGCSLTGAAFAARLADMFSAFAPAADQVKAAAESFCAKNIPDAMDKGTFAGQLCGVRDSFIALADNGIEVLDSAGYTPAGYPWDNENVLGLMTAAVSAMEKDIFAPVLDKYYAALSEGWDREKLMEQGVNYMAPDCGENPLESVGYAVTDLDGDGLSELIIGTLADDNDFLRCMVLDMYCVGDFGGANQVFTSGERDRLYSMGGALFNHIGSSGADDSFDTVEQYADGVMINLGYAGEELAPLPLMPLSSFRN